MNLGGMDYIWIFFKRLLSLFGHSHLYIVPSRVHFDSGSPTGIPPLALNPPQHLEHGHCLVWIGAGADLPFQGTRSFFACSVIFLEQRTSLSNSKGIGSNGLKLIHNFVWISLSRAEIFRFMHSPNSLHWEQISRKQLCRANVMGNRGCLVNYS